MASLLEKKKPDTFLGNREKQKKVEAEARCFAKTKKSISLWLVEVSGEVN